MDIFDVITYAWRGRLLFRSDAEYRQLLGVTYETVRDRRDDSSALEGYYNMLNDECRRQCGETLYAMVAMWLEVSDPDIVWRERCQLASRKKFCRWLFRMAAAPSVPLTVDQELRYSPKSCDNELAGLGLDEAFLLLVTFKVIKPLAMMRGRDITVDDNSRLAALVAQLKEDMPQAPTLAKPLAFDIVMEELKAPKSVAQMWEMLRRIAHACGAVYAPTEAFPTRGLSLPGVWLDDADENRFWLFPENMLMAFCYSNNGSGWTLRAYEFVEAGNDKCVFISTRGNEQLLAHGVMDYAEVAAVGYEYDGQCISFKPETGQVPTWLNWRRFTRVDSDLQYRQLLRHIYTPGTLQSMLFSNESALLTDSVDALVAIDSVYIYVWDAPQVASVLRWRDGAYVYGPVKARPLSLLNIDISDSHPLYIIPRECRGRDRHFCRSASLMEFGHQATIYHTGLYPEGILCLNNFSAMLPLSEAEGYGIRKVCSR